MIEYRFKPVKDVDLNVVNSYMPKGRTFKIDNFTGEAWIKVTNLEHTPELEMRVIMYCELINCQSTLSIRDCSSMAHTASHDDSRPSLFE